MNNDLDIIDCADLPRIARRIGFRARPDHGKLPDHELVQAARVLGALSRLWNHAEFFAYGAAMIDCRGTIGSASLENIDEAIEALERHRANVARGEVKR